MSERKQIINPHRENGLLVGYIVEDGDIRKVRVKEAREE